MRLIDADTLEPDTEWDAYEDGYLSYSQVAIDSAPTIEISPTTGWIPCSERMPEVNGGWSDDVLILMRRFGNPWERKEEYFEIFVGYYAPDKGWYTMMHNSRHPVGVEKQPPYPEDWGICRTTDEVTHWMPLPEPPKGGS